MLMLALYINTNLLLSSGKRGYLKNLEKLNFQFFLNQGAFVPVLVLGLHIIILYNLSAPPVLTTLLYLTLLVSVCFLFRQNWQKQYAITGYYSSLSYFLQSLSFPLAFFVPVSF